MAIFAVLTLLPFSCVSEEIGEEAGEFVTGESNAKLPSFPSDGPFTNSTCDIDYFYLYTTKDWNVKIDTGGCSGLANLEAIRWRLYQLDNGAAKGSTTYYPPNLSHSNHHTTVQSANLQWGKYYCVQMELDLPNGGWGKADVDCKQFF